MAQPVIESVQSSDNRLVRATRSPGANAARTPASPSSRSQFNLYGKSNLIGIGPASTKAKLGASNFAAVKEAHSDYLASLVERGPLGVVGLIALFGAVGARTMGLGSPDHDQGVPGGGARTRSALRGVPSAFAFTGITHEVLHYRHLWTLLAVRWPPCTSRPSRRGRPQRPQRRPRLIPLHLRRCVTQPPSTLRRRRSDSSRTNSVGRSSAFACGRSPGSAWSSSLARAGGPQIARASSSSR